MSTDKTNRTPVMGYLASNWLELNEHTPAVVLNPEASPLDLLAWCWGELRSMQAAADRMSSGNDDINPGDFSALISHRLDPMADVFEVAIDLLLKEKESKHGTEQNAAQPSGRV